MNYILIIYFYIILMNKNNISEDEYLTDDIDKFKQYDNVDKAINDLKINILNYDNLKSFPLNPLFYTISHFTIYYYRAYHETLTNKDYVIMSVDMIYKYVDESYHDLKYLYGIKLNKSLLNNFIYKLSYLNDDNKRYDVVEIHTDNISNFSRDYSYDYDE